MRPSVVDAIESQPCRRETGEQPPGSSPRFAGSYCAGGIRESGSVMRDRLQTRARRLSEIFISILERGYPCVTGRSLSLFVDLLVE